MNENDTTSDGCHVNLKLIEAIMIIPNWTSEDLKKLPLRAIVAFASRCARRVEQLAIPPDGHPEHGKCGSAVRDAIRMADEVARDSPDTSVESVIPAIDACRDTAQGQLVRDHAIAAVTWTAHAAAAALKAVALQGEPEQYHQFTPPTRPFAHLADVTAEIAALDAFTAAMAASDAAGYSENFIGGAVGDYEKLLKLNLGSYPAAGQPVDPSPDGPLGPL